MGGVSWFFGTLDMVDKLLMFTFDLGIFLFLCSECIGVSKKIPWWSYQSTCFNAIGYNPISNCAISAQGTGDIANNVAMRFTSASENMT